MLNAVLIGVAIGIVGSHAIWMKGAGRRNGADIRVAYFWEEKTRQLLDTDYPQELKDEHRALQAKSGYFLTYSFAFQFIITFLLAVAIICAVWCQQCTQQPGANDSSKHKALGVTWLEQIDALRSSRVAQRVACLGGEAARGISTRAESPPGHTAPR